MYTPSDISKATRAVDSRGVTGILQAMPGRAASVGPATRTARELLVDGLLSALVGDHVALDEACRTLARRFDSPDGMQRLAEALIDATLPPTASTCGSLDAESVPAWSRRSRN